MTIQQEQLSDEDLASKISEDGRLSQDSPTHEEEGFLETGVHANSSVLEDETDPSLQEEPFSVNDFEEGSQMVDVGSSSPEPDNAPSVSDEKTEFQNSRENEIASSSELNSDPGEVAEFRKTLSALSRQLEIDRLTLLYKHMKEEGKPLPDLGKIASDIRGDSQFQPIGDEDIYSKRPLARLQGWIAGLSFGIGRRAKKFSR